MTVLRRLPRALTFLTVTLAGLAVLLGLSLSSLTPRTPGREVTYTDALNLASSGQVAKATFYDQDSRAVLKTSDGATLWVAYQSGGAGGANLQKSLTDAKADVSVDQQPGKRVTTLFAEFILPLLLLANLFGIFILLASGGASQVRGLFAFSRIGAARARPENNPVRFSDCAAVDEAVVELAEVRDYLEDPRRFAAVGALPPKGVLLYGPPGCGKTLLARALAGEARVPFYALSGSEFVESLVGVGAARVRDLFRQAQDTAPAIIFVDELDAAGRRRGAGVGGGHDEREQTLNELLVRMDGFSPTSGVVVVGATNRPDILDPALLRPGRFDRHVRIELPDLAGREAILRLHAGGRPIDADVDLDIIARATPGFTGADLASVLNEAALLAVRRRVTSIGGDDLVEAVQRVAAGPRRRGRILTREELGRIAYHEAGHAVVTSELNYPVELQRVSVVARGRDLASADLLPRSDRTVFTRHELLDELAIVMAGLAAEELVSGDVSTIAESDVERATDLARRFAGRYGMSERVGRMRVVKREEEVFLGRDYLTTQSLSSQTLEDLDGAVRDLMASAENRALQVLQRRRATLDQLAAALVQRETIVQPELAELLRPATSPTRRGQRAAAR